MQQNPSAILPQGSNSNISQAQVVQLIWKVIQQMRGRGDEESMLCLLNEEKLIHLALLVSQRHPQTKWTFNLQEEMTGFVQKVNKMVMQNFKEEESDAMDLQIFSKAVDILMHPRVAMHIQDLASLGKLKVLTFNNLACFYKKKKKFQLALKAVSYALDIEEYLAKNDERQQKYDIIPTYLNKAAIYSEMKKHDRAIEEIMKSKKYIENIEKEVCRQLTDSSTDPVLRKRLEQKKHYGLYMKMLINYNMGAEKEHLKLVDSAAEHYEEGRKLAVIINNTFMIDKFNSILKDIAKSKNR